MVKICAARRLWLSGTTRYLCRAETLPEEYVPEITEAIGRIGLNWKDFKLVDNSCPPHPKESFAQSLAGSLKDINPTTTTPEESPVNVGQGPKYSYMDTDKSGDPEKPAAAGDNDTPLTQFAP